MELVEERVLVGNEAIGKEENGDTMWLEGKRRIGKVIYMTGKRT